MSEGGDDDKGMVSDNEGARCLVERERSRPIRDGICVCVTVVVVVVAMVVALMETRRVAVLMVIVGIVVLVMLVRVLCIGVVGVVKVLCIGTLEVDCAGGVDVLVLSGVFMVEVAEGVELVVEYVVRLVLWRVTERGYFLCRFNLKLVEMYR